MFNPIRVRALLAAVLLSVSAAGAIVATPAMAADTPPAATKYKRL